MPVPVDSAHPPVSGSNARTMSRRGGRNVASRARSPAVPRTAEDNPSSAAAAAAAAAKAYSDNRGQWERRAQREEPAYGYHWPGGRGSEPGYFPEGRFAVREDPYRYSDNYERPYEAERPRYHPRDFRHSRERRGGTSLVIGGTTPIHLPKSMDDEIEKSKVEERHTTRQGSAASVFRGRPEESVVTVKKDRGDEDSPQKILLSLRTPTMSFDSKDGAEKVKKSNKFSPDGPPVMNSKRDQFFERSPSGADKNNSSDLEMAPSFTLFNQSFDSLGDVQLNIDSTLQVDSFGLNKTASLGEGNTQLLERNPSSSTNFASQLLNPSGSGGLTMNFSPVNSFGYTSGAAPPRREGNMIVLGGPDQRAASPTQVLNMYRNHSARHQSGDTLQSIKPKFPRHAVGPADGRSYYHGLSSTRSMNDDFAPHFYHFLIKYKEAFKGCIFLLPGLKDALKESSTSSKEVDGIDEYKEMSKVGMQWQSKPSTVQSSYIGRGGIVVYPEPSPQDIVVARRRVESSVCAFGGSISSRFQRASTTDDPKASIFRGKSNDSVTVTPSSSIASPRASDTRSKYEQLMSGRYYENESRLSWEFEESPPIEIPQEDEAVSKKRKNSIEKNERDRVDDDQKSSDESDDSVKRSSSTSPQPKMRYRCKLCGQPKQNHVCPFQPSLARSIGVMIYPCVNAFAAHEPGVVAPPLTMMNNFVEFNKDSTLAVETSSQRPTPERINKGPSPPGAQVTPESVRSNTPNVPTSASSNVVHSQTPRKRKANGHQNDNADLLFREATPLKDEQLRLVNEPLSRSFEAYRYPCLPLPYAQRKRLSDNLFSLSNEVPRLTDECAKVLREAREKDMWDQAVAELMTQVITVIHCRDGDHTFEGLRTYLLTLGIAC